jgi:glycosyltransferase involved in cell wall biosynthesis
LPARLVTEHEVGVVVPFGDAAATAAVVRALAADPRRREALGRRAHELARQRFDWGREGPLFAAQLAVWARRSEPVTR